MNPQRLLQHFDRIAEAPDAVARLRRFILDLAVRGKLVEQDPNDEPASALLGSLSTIAAEQWPSMVRESEPASFTLPGGWFWSRLGLIATKTGSGSTPRGGRSVYKSQGVPFLRSQNIYNDGLRLEDVAYIDHETHARMTGTSVEPGDLLLNITGGSIGRCARVPDSPIDANVSQHVAIIRVAHSGMRDFIHRVILSPFFQSFVVNEQTGAGRGGLPKNRMDQIMLPIPPLAEQHRIVAKVDELMALCDRLEAAQKKREQRRDRLNAASLNRINQPGPSADGEAATAFREHARFHLDHLPRLTTRPEHIKSLRQTILNLAVRGRLVPQDPEDEQSSELLKRIAAEKAAFMKAGEIRRESSLPLPSESEAAFELPSGWSWVRLGNLSQLVTSGSRDWAKHYSNEGAIFVRMGNLSKDHYRLRLDNIQRVSPPAGGEGTRTRIESGDILVSITGDVGMLGLIPDGFGEAYINQHTAMVRPMPEMKGRYLAELFRSPFAQHQFNKPQRGIKNSFRLTDVTQFIVPLPPLAEQHRIVAKLDQLMAICDKLEAQLTTTQTDSRRLLEAVLQEALVPATERAMTT